MPKITGQITDFGFSALPGHNLRLLFRHNTPGVAGTAIMTTRPVEVIPSYNGYFEADLVAAARIAPAGFYTVTLEWTEPPSRKKYHETFPGRLYVPAAGGILADILRIPSNPAAVWTGEEPPANPSPGTWWMDGEGRLNEYGETGWNFKENLRGPAGYNATGAAEDIATLAAYANQAAGPNAFSAALERVVARQRPTPDLLAGLSDPVYCGHRGGPFVYPEMSMEAFRACAASGFIFEIDVQELGDGTLVCLHDETTGRTMTGPDTNVAAMTRADFLARRIKPVIAGGREAIPVLWEDVLNEFGGRTLFVAEIKVDAKKYTPPERVRRIMAPIINRGLEKSVVLASFSYEVCKQVAAAGIHAQFVNGAAPAAEVTPAQMKADGVTIVSADFNAAESTVRNLQAVGIKVWAWTVNRRTITASTLAKGFTGIVSDDPWRMSGRYVTKNHESFDSGYLWPQPISDGVANIHLDALTPGLGFKYGGVGKTASIRLGQFGAGPVAGTYRFRLHFKAGAADKSRWLGFFVGSLHIDEAFLEGASPAAQGYHFLIRRNGQKNIYRVGGGTTDLGVSASPIAPWQPATVDTDAAEAGEFEIVITATTITLRCLSDGTEISVQDATHRMTDAVLSVRSSATAVTLSDLRVVR